MQICRREPKTCARASVPLCVADRDEFEAASLRKAMGQICEKGTAIARRWCELVSETAEGLVLSEQESLAEVEELLRTGAGTDIGALCRYLVAADRRTFVSGLPLEAAILRLQLLNLACSEVAAGPGPATPETVRSTNALARFTAARVTLLTCIYAGEQGAAGPPGELARAEGLEPRSRTQFCGLVGASAPMRELYASIEKAARRRETVLLVGESGTGKELVARAIHAVSGDPQGSFVAANCAALPRDLLESELFGHRRGAFSSAHTAHAGLIRAADGGTFFLDEISELPPPAQAKLLRVIQERAVRGVGETREAPVDVRFVAATNVEPETLLATGLLRRDLYYRLQRMVIAMPPLRQRREDIPLLAHHFAERWQKSAGCAPRLLSDAALARLALHSWPGNVRELQNVVAVACEAGSERWIKVSDLPRLEPLDAAVPPEARSEPIAPISLRDAERIAIENAVRQAGGNKSLASRVLGISRKQLYVKLKLYRLGAEAPAG